MIPKKAKKVFEGVIFDVYHWPQKMYDGSVRTFEKIKRKDSVLVIGVVKDKIMISKEKSPNVKTWSYGLTGGRVDKRGETPKKAAARELLEETGLKAGSLKLLKRFKRRGHINFDVFLYIARDLKKVAEPQLDGGELIKIEHVSYKKFKDIMSSQATFFADSMIPLYIARAKYDKKFDRQLKKAIFG